MASKSRKKEFEKEFVKNFKIESVLNRDGDQLPFALFSPESDGTVSWACGEDQHGNVTSVFKYETGTSEPNETNAEYVTKAKALHLRDTLLDSGWKKSVAPAVRMQHPDTGKELNRKERRKLAKHLVRNKGVLDNPRSGNGRPETRRKT